MLTEDAASLFSDLLSEVLPDEKRNHTTTLTAAKTAPIMYAVLIVKNAVVDIARIIIAVPTVTPYPITTPTFCGSYTDPMIFEPDAVINPMETPRSIIQIKSCV